MRNVRITVSYDGTRYNGFQVQPDLPTVQAKLLEAISAVTGEKDVILHGSGRTDAGVHARGQVVNFATASRLPADRWCQALNAYLPRDIIVWEASEVPERFHARKSAKRKTYRYTINANRFPDPLMLPYELHHPGPLDVSAMAEAIRRFEGVHDFSSFCSSRSVSDSKIRTLYEARMDIEPIPGMEKAQGAGRIQLIFTGNGFLYNMVRILSGTLIAVGEGKLSAMDIERILEARDRSLAGPTAKAHALSLWHVHYDFYF
jgi:tRNA pseudouridine38-40 synthase